MNMYWLNIFNANLVIIAEMLAIIVGSMLMGILLSYLQWGHLRKKEKELSNTLILEKEQTEELKYQLKQLNVVRAQLQSEISDGDLKHDVQAKKIYDQQLQLFDQQQYSNDLETLTKSQKSALDELNSTIDSYQHRLRVIEEELFKTKNATTPTKKATSIPASRANYEHVSKLLGRQVTENDLTLISGIGPKTASLLQTNGISTWEILSSTPLDTLQKILSEAGGVYKSIDPTHWPKQAIMASKSEWRKLRVFQESLKKGE